jgi:hypothetical protein
VPLIDSIAMGQRLSLLTAVVMWQSSWCSKSFKWCGNLRGGVFAGVGYLTLLVSSVEFSFSVDFLSRCCSDVS